MRIPQACLAVLQVIFTVAIARETMAETQKAFASQVPPIAPGTDETSRRDVVDAIKLLKDKDPERRALGARLLAGLGDNAAPAIPELIALLGDGHVAERDGLLFCRTVGQVASLALESIGPKAVPALADAMITRPEKAIRIAAASTLVELLDKSDQKPLILRGLDRAAADREDAVRRVAVQGLGRMGPMANPALAHLIEIVKGDPSEWVRFEAVTSLGLIDPRGERVIPHLTDALKDRSADVSWAAARSLGKLGPFAKSSVPALTAALDDPREHHLPLTPDFTWMRALRCDVADALGRIGIEANAAIPALRKAVAKDRNPEVRVFAALALSRIDPKDQGVVSAIIRELEDKGEGTSGPAAAIEALADLGPKARAAVPALLRSLAHDEPSIRSGAARALAAVGDRAVIPDLERLLEDKDNLVRDTARASLEQLAAAQK
jgi:HEAT repeat protein